MQFDFDENLVNILDRKIRKDFSDFDFLTEEKKNLEKMLLLQQEESRYAEDGRVVIQKIAKELQERLRFQISSVVESALNSVFDDKYEFKVDFVERRGKIEADLLFLKDGEAVTPFDDEAGGVLDVTSFALKMTFLFFIGNRKVIIVDEPFRNLSVDFQSRCSAMLKLISEKLGFQILMVSHLPEIINSADFVYTISDGKVINSDQNKEIDGKVENFNIKKVERIKLEKRKNE
jgi:DNA repair ATPase RecN